MKRSAIETIIGAIVIAVAGLFLTYSIKTAEVTQTDGYTIMADFTTVGGLKPGDKVQISGVKVGSVAAVELLPDSYLARVHINLKNEYKLPLDTAALISSESLLGGQYLALEPGAEEDTLEAGDKVEYTQAPQNLEQILGQFIFSMQNDDKEDDETAN